jgi:DNA-binding NtrC family response regulator
VLERHPWPGNVRELRNVMERALTVCPRDVIDADAILLDPVEPQLASEPTTSVAVTSPPPAGPQARGRLVRPDRSTECAMIMKALEEAGGHQGRAAEKLGISRRTLINRLDEYGLRRPRKR